MKITKENISKRVLQKGEPLPQDKFSWDENTRTFSSAESCLVLDFSDLDNCTFKTGSNCTFDTDSNCTFDTSSSCTFKTGSDCTFKTSSYCAFNTSSSCTFKTGSGCAFNTSSNCTFDTGSNCTFDTGSSCTFKTGYGCTFKTGYGCTFKTGYGCTFKTGYGCTFKTSSECVVIRRDIFEVILLKENIKTSLCPYKIKGYLEEIDDKYYLNGNVEGGEYIIVDNILSKVLKRKGSVIKVQNHSDTEESYIVEQNGYYSHGRTLEEARESLLYKMSTRDLSEFKELNLDSILSKEESIRMYMSITGACALGTKRFIDSREIKEEYSVREIIEVTIGQYGNEKLKEFFKLK